MTTERPQPARQRIIIVSDLHLGATSRPGHFEHDGEFQRFLEYLTQDAIRNSLGLRLVMLGDIFDFPSVPSMSGNRRDSDADLVDRLQRVLYCHPLFTQALNAFVAAGNRLDFLPGNHDPGLMRLTVQTLIRSALSAPSESDLRFHPWIFSLPGLLYAEHGNQYHDINSFPEWLNAQAHPLNETGKPIGAKLDDLVMTLASKTDRSANSVPISLTGVVRHQLHDPRKLVRSLPVFARFGVEVIRASISIWSPIDARRRRHYRRTWMSVAEAETGLSLSVLAAIDRLAERNARAWPGRIWKSGRSLFVTRLRRKGTRSGSATGLAMTGETRKTHFSETGKTIAKILADDGQAAPIIAFGHTHLADLAHYPESTVVNAGTWLDAEPGNSSAGPRQSEMSFIRIDVDVSTDNPDVALLKWNDAGRNIQS
jgi:UDP-2,3-diacylglucosamine pyrophosphatase LpxH